MEGRSGDTEPGEDAALVAWLLDRCRRGETDALTARLDTGVPATTADHKGNSLIMMAAYHGWADTVRALVERGGEVDALNDRGQSPLAGAVFKGHDDVVVALLEAGADPFAGTPSARDTATFFERADILALIDTHLARGGDAER